MQKQTKKVSQQSEGKKKVLVQLSVITYSNVLHTDSNPNYYSGSGITSYSTFTVTETDNLMNILTLRVYHLSIVHKLQRLVSWTDK
jgi:hypothetical protein